MICNINNINIPLYFFRYFVAAFNLAQILKRVYMVVGNPQMIYWTAMPIKTLRNPKIKETLELQGMLFSNVGRKCPQQIFLMAP